MVVYFKRSWIFIKRKRKWFYITIPFALWYWLCLPAQLFNETYSTILESREGDLLSASIAKDGQWRFPHTTEIPEKFLTAVVHFEDKRFYSHPGVDIFSLGRAMKQNLARRKIVSGASTISMQVIRLSRKEKKRTILEKCFEILLATRLELKYSKNEILSLYSSHAPFGGNVVGLQAACWRYFGRNEKQLSWGEAALLAVLPNSPSMIHPGKNRDALKIKRDDLLEKLRLAGKIDSFACVLAKAEPIPEKPVALPRMARHLLGRAGADGHTQKRVTSTLDFSLQQRVEQILNDHYPRLKGKQIHNAAAIVASVRTGEVLAYAGNISMNQKGTDVDIIHASRSTGSILKPFLYAALLDDGKILPGTLLPDIPTFINGFTPKNFSKEYDGSVPADKALIRSLNVPAVHMLREYHYERFHALLKNAGIQTLKKEPDHYGLSLILGGAEGTLWDITGVYASMARTLNNYFEHPGRQRYQKEDFHSLRYLSSSNEQTSTLMENSWFSAASIFLTFDALKELYRPGEESGWRYFESSKNIAWKTGTSYGFRDGWAVGVTPEYAVGIWVGNADGDGRPGLTGTDAAAPILFDVFSQLDNNGWFKRPTQEMKEIKVCRKSGFRYGVNCEDGDSRWVPNSGLESLPCPFHRKVHLSSDRRFQVNNICAPLVDIKEENWFVLPAVQEYYYKSRNAAYAALPPFRGGCPSPGKERMMDLVYPKMESKILIPRDIGGNPGSAILHLAHRNPTAVVFWHLDGQFIGSTQKSHYLAINPPSGKHTIVVMDESGEYLEQNFEILSGL